MSTREHLQSRPDRQTSTGSRSQASKISVVRIHMDLATALRMSSQITAGTQIWRRACCRCMLSGGSKCTFWLALSLAGSGKPETDITVPLQSELESNKTANKCAVCASSRFFVSLSWRSLECGIRSLTGLRERSARFVPLTARGPREFSTAMAAATVPSVGTVHAGGAILPRTSFTSSSVKLVPCKSNLKDTRPLGVRASSGNGAVGGSTRFHRLIQENGVVLMPGCYDALSAAILEKTGFNAGFISGYAMSASLLGKPDFGFLTPPEMAANARLICAAASKIPIIADADTGGGNALNVQRTVRDLIAAGAAGCFLEDQVWPKKCGHMRGKQVIPAEEHAAKIAAARDAVGSADFFLVARTDARATSAKTGLEDAIARANLYMEAGADASFVEAPRDDSELIEIGKRTKGPRVCNMLEGGVTPLHTADELQAMGFQLIVHPLTTLYASARALMDIAKELKEKGTTRHKLDTLATFEEFNELVGLESWFQLESKYSPAKSPVSSSTK